MSQHSPDAYLFGPFRFDVRDQRLQREGQTVELPPKAARVLLALLEAQGHVLTREELDERVWGDTVVGLGSLTFQVHLLRRALGDAPDGQPFIKTVPRRGYLIAVPIRPIVHADEQPDALTSQPSSERAVALPAAALESAAPEAERRPTRRRRWPAWAGVAVALVVVLVLVAAAAATLWSPRPAPRVVRYAQLSHDGRTKSIGQPMFLDGSRVYFREGIGLTLSSVPVNGGETSSVATSGLGLDISDISESTSEYLAIRRVRGQREGELWIVPMLSGQPRRVGEARCVWAVWAPDGAKIACTTATSVVLLNPDGASVRLLTIPEGHLDWPRWSPDGRLLRFTVNVPANRTVTRTIWEVRSDGEGLRQLLRGWPHSSQVCCGDWTPDGRHFVFEARRGETSNLWVLREARGLLPADSKGEPSQLTDGPLSFYVPTWSADGTKVFALGVQARGELVRYDQPLQEFVPYLGGMSATWVSVCRQQDLVAYTTFPEHVLWLARRDGSEKRQLTFPPMEVDGSEISPDGEWIAFRARTADRPKKIYLLSVHGGAPQPLTSEGVAQGIPSWSPDSQQLTFGDVPAVFGRPAGDEAIHIYNVSRKAWSTVPSSQGLWKSRWSPDGRYIAALTIQGQKLRLFDIHTSRWRELAADHLNTPHWSRDGKFIYYDTESNIRALRRVRIADGHVEDIASLAKFPTAAYWWSGLAPDDSPLMLRNIGALEAYALDVKFR